MNSSDDEFALTARGLTVSRGKVPVLHGLDFSLPAGSVVGLMGPSGCGKTTLMRSIVGVQRIDAGELTVLGLDPRDPALRSQIGYVTQAVSVYSDLSVRDNATYFAALQGFSQDDAERAIATVGLAELAERPVSTLSGGQASRASLAGALVGRPRLLVLDEPTVGLDPVTREEIWGHLRALADDGATLLVSSHVMDEAARCDSVLLMRQGHLLGHLTPSQLLEQTGADNADDAFLTLIRQGAAR